MALFRQFLVTFAACAVLACLGLVDTVMGQAGNAVAAPKSVIQVGNDFENKVQPVLSKNCFACHNAKVQRGALDLSAYSSESVATKKPELWEKVLDKVASGKMPPAGMKRPTEQETAALSAWIEPLLARSGYRRDGDPGRVLARRLNRTEYNNTIQDLLGIAFRPADDFPVDDSGYGFDNIADVLTVSPMLMEKYLTAAKKASRLAVYGESYPAKPTLIGHLLAKRSYDIAASSDSRYLPYSMRGNLYGSFVFPVNAEYELRFRAMNLREDVRVPGVNRDPNGGPAAGPPPTARQSNGPLTPEQRAARARRVRELTPEQRQALTEQARTSAPPLKIVLTLDGKPVLTDVIEGTTTFGYARGEFVARVPVTAGEHELRVSFPELANIDDPRQHLNPDQRRKVFVDYLDVVGPFSPSAAKSDSYKRLFVCGHTERKHMASCSRQIVSNLLRRAYRRQPTPDEIEDKLRLVRAARREGDTFDEGIRLALEATLASPKFLFRLEKDPGASAAPQSAHLVSEYELASRLSYFLWASMPDYQLLQAAESRQLRKPEVLTAQIRRMLADPKSANLVENFAAQWLQLRTLGRTKPDGAKFPTIDDELLDAMKRETSLFIQAIFREDRSVLDVIDAPFTYLNGPLARHYGIKGVDGEEFRRVELDGKQRGGLLTQAAVLTVSSYPTRTSIPVRGKWVLENLLGAAPPPPPPDVPVLDESKLGTSVSLRERLEQHRTDPNCSSCHNAMDPIGFGLESYDAVGAWRTHDGKVPIDTSGVLPDGRSFTGAPGLKKILRDQADAFTRNLAEKLLTFALGRGLERSDKSTLDAIAKRVAASDYRFSALVVETVNSKPFQMRSALGVTR